MWIFQSYFFPVWIILSNKKYLADEHGSWTRWLFIMMATLALSCAPWEIVILNMPRK